MSCVLLVRRTTSTPDARTFPYFHPVPNLRACMGEMHTCVWARSRHLSLEYQQCAGIRTFLEAEGFAGRASPPVAREWGLRGKESLERRGSSFVLVACFSNPREERTAQAAHGRQLNTMCMTSLESVLDLDKNAYFSCVYQPDIPGSLLSPLVLSSAKFLPAQAIPSPCFGMEKTSKR